MTVDIGDLALVVLTALCLAVFVYLLVAVLKGKPMRIDGLCHSLFVEKLRSPALTVVMKAVSNLASVPFIVGTLLTAFVWRLAGFRLF